MWIILRHNIFGNSDHGVMTVLGVITGVITLITPSHNRDHGERSDHTRDHTVITKYFYWGAGGSPKLEMHSLGPTLPETIGLPAGIVLCILVFLVIFPKTEPLVSHLSNMPVCEQSIYS